MMTLVRSWSLRFFAASLVLATLPVSAEDAVGVVHLGQSADVGVVRVSDLPQSPTVRGQSENVQQTACRTCPSGHVHAGQVDQYCPGPYLFEDTALGNWVACSVDYICMRKDQVCGSLHASCRADLEEKKQFLRCKFGYFCPTGPDGKGVPPFGRYNMVYPVNPGYFDQRDGQVYAAAGYGGPVSVPIAPVVNHTYNYGWGVPSSRLTPIAHPLTQGVPVPTQAR